MYPVTSFLKRFVLAIPCQPEALSSSTLHEIHQYLPSTISQNLSLLDKPRSVYLCSTKKPPFQITWQKVERKNGQFYAPRLIDKNSQLFTTSDQIKPAELSLDEIHRTVTLRDLSEELTQLGNIDGAVDAALRIFEKFEKDFALWDISRSLRKLGNMNKAFKVAWLISDKNIREAALQEIPKPI
jgi:hypothetical protein